MYRLLALLATFTPFATAHEIGTTRIDVYWLDNAKYRIEIATGANALAEKLAAANGHAPAAPRALAGLIGRKISVRFDGAPAEPQIAYSENAGTGNIELTGSIPEGARQFTWNFGWTYVAYAMTIHPGSETIWLEGARTMPIVRPSPTRLQVAWRYLALGFTHILPFGLDHVLFVLGIYLLSNRGSSLLLQVTAFTVAHSLTLGLGIFGAVSVSASIVEPLIAVSIAYVAIENLFLKELRPWRVALVFGFGLLHGLGFAGVLTELGLPRKDFLIALLTFNLGVEAGQLAVIGLAFLLIGWRWSGQSWYRARVAIPASLLIAATALFWTVGRLST